MNETNAGDSAETERREAIAKWLAQTQEPSSALIAELERRVEELTEERDEARAELWQEKKNRPGLYGQLLKMKTQLAEREEDRALLDAAASLVEKLDIIHSNPEYQSVWLCAHNHGLPYRGPKYEAELKALRAAIRAARAQPEDGK